MSKLAECLHFTGRKTKAFDAERKKKSVRASAMYSNAGRNAGAMEKPHGFVTGGLEVF